MFTYAQGHANAFGICIPDTNLNDFHNLANKLLADYNFGENVFDVNFIRNAKDADLYKLIMEIGAFPYIWGQGNKEALIYINPVTINPNDLMVMGSNRDTLKININGIDYIKFFATDLIDELTAKNEPVKIELVCKANINEWMGRKTPQMLIESYEIIQQNTERRR